MDGVMMELTGIKTKMPIYCLDITTTAPHCLKTTAKT